MPIKVTLILNIHNRQSNLSRLLDYYKGEEFAIFIADSSASAFTFAGPLAGHVKYFHLPGISYTQKIECILAEVHSPYVVLSADDDFVVTEGLGDAVRFLEKHNDYAVAQGKVIKFFEDSLKGPIRYDLSYNTDHSLEFPAPAKRITNMFFPFKTLFCAVHRTSVLRFVFDGAGKTLNNLYLNEYLVCIGALIMGKSKDLDSLFQVREYAESSDGTTTDNLDTIIHDQRYAKVYADFIAYLRKKIDTLPENERVGLDRIIEQALKSYADELVKFRTRPVSFFKYAGRAISSIPFVGDAFIRRRRVKKSNDTVQKQLSKAELEQLTKVTKVLKDQIKETSS